MPNNEKQPQVVTFGCRLNIYESEIIKSHLATNGLDDAIVFNTCAVTNEAERQARQSIRKIKRENPNAKIIVTGCSAQINPQMYADMPEVDRVLGNKEKMLADSYDPKDERSMVVSDIMQLKESAHHLISGFESKVRAFIEIQNGCDHRCTFCTIPFGRGNNRSIPVAQIVNQVQALVDSGSKEIIFTGVDITGYGGDLPGKPTLGQMLRRVFTQVPDLPRLRLSSLDPAELDEDVYRLIADEPRLMPHFHISLQSGDNMILKRMKRRHLRDDIIVFCKSVRELRPDAIFGADIIAGFPTETDEMHQNSMKILRECDIAIVHAFPFSPRKSTPASRMPQVPTSIVKARAAQLRAIGEENYQKFLTSWVGKTVSVLLQRDGEAYSTHYAPVFVPELANSPDLIGEIFDIYITGKTDKNLIGQLKLKQVA